LDCCNDEVNCMDMHMATLATMAKQADMMRTEEKCIKGTTMERSNRRAFRQEQEQGYDKDE